MTMKSSRIVKNASWIIACKIVQALLSIVVTMLSARFLGPSGYGLINYAASIVAFAAPIMYLGLNSVIVQELVSNPEGEGKTLGSAIGMSFFASFFCIGGVMAFVLIANKGETDTFIICSLYSILLISQSLEMIIYWFQAKLLSKYSSIVSLIAYIVISIYKIILLATGQSVYLFAISNALDYLIIALLSFGYYKKLGGQKLSFSFSAFRKMFTSSKYYIIANLMVTVYAQTDRIMIKLMIDDAATGYYSAAVTCAGMTGFVFSAIIDSFRPMIFDDKKNNQGSYEKNVIRLYNVVIYLSLVQCVVITACSGIVIRILYGTDYMNSVDALRIIVWYTTFSYLGAVRNIWLLAEGKQKFLLWINLIGAVSNIILNYFLITCMGINGAALASLITQFVTNVVVGFIFKPIRKNNKLMWNAMNPKITVELFKCIKGQKMR